MILHESTEQYRWMSSKIAFDGPDQVSTGGDRISALDKKVAKIKINLNGASNDAVYDLALAA